MNLKRFPPLLIGLAAMALVSLACILTPNAASNAPTEAISSNPPEATQSSAAGQVIATADGSGLQTPVQFSEADCACGGLTVSKAFPWGESIECRYDWSGANVDDNQLGFQLTRDYHVEQWDDRFARDREDLTVEFSGGTSDQVVSEFLNEQEAYGFMTTRTGWSRDNVEIPVCGFGKSEKLYAGEWLILTDLRSCESPNSMDGYIAQFQRVENCAMDLVDAKMTNE